MSNSIQARSLDDLPENVLTHILTFLPTLDAVRTSLLSREWQSQKLWRTLPFLDFFIRFNHMDVWTRFTDFIDQTLKNRSGFPIQKFRFRLVLYSSVQLEHDDYERIQSKLDDWISFAISHKATELDINLPYGFWYYFKFGLLNNSCVRDLRIFGGILHHGKPSLNLDSIRSVRLFGISLTDETLVDLISWCNNLESLVIKYCFGMEHLIICSSTLKKLSVGGNIGSSMEICCPNLCSLSIYDFQMNDYCIKDSASVVEVDVHFTGWLGNRSNAFAYWNKVVRLLIIVNLRMAQHYWFEDASFEGCMFENLNQLELETEYGHCDLLRMAVLLKDCPNITTLTLDFSLHVNELNSCVLKELVEKPIEFSIPNLKILNLRNLMKPTKIEELVELMKKHGDALEKIFLVGPER